MSTQLKRIALGFILLVGLMWLNGANVAAQSTLFNIPSTDVLPEKKVYLEFDFISHFERHRNGGFQVYVPRAVFGLAKRTEVGVNIAFTDALAPNQPVEIQPNVKVQLYNNEKRGVAASVGGIAYLPVTNRAGTDTFGMVYVVFSKKVKADKGPRLTGGAYALVGRLSGTGTRSGAIVGYEQPLHSHVSFVTDWFSGKNRFGYVTPGLAITVSKRSLFYAGYSIGNEGRKNNGLFLYYGITF
jgi:hypothetical protein